MCKEVDYAKLCSGNPKKYLDFYEQDYFISRKMGHNARETRLWNLKTCRSIISIF